MLIKGKLFDKAGIPLYEKLLKVTSSAQKTTASNIANVATPGYKVKSVDFKSEMKRLLNQKSSVAPVTTDSRHISVGTPRNAVRVKEIQSNRNTSGVNNVDIEQEMMNLSENELIYKFGAGKLARTFGLLKMAIRGRGQ
jgi:flagellar basal-body rod protein FlgB